MNKRHVLTGVLSAGLVSNLLSACETSATPLPQPPTLTATPEGWKTRTAETQQAFQVTLTVEAAAYDLKPGETKHSIGLGGDISHDGVFSIGNGGTRIEEYIDEAGRTSQRRIAMVWIGSRQHPAGAPQAVHIGQVVEFEGYQIRVLDIREKLVVVAISKLNEQ